MCGLWYAVCLCLCVCMFVFACAKCVRCNCVCSCVCVSVISRAENFREKDVRGGDSPSRTNKGPWWTVLSAATQEGNTHRGV